MYIALVGACSYGYYEMYDDATGRPFTLIYTAAAGGILSGVFRQTVRTGDSGTPVDAIPSSGYLFTKWSDGVTNNPRIDMRVAWNINTEAGFIYKIAYIRFDSQGADVPAVPGSLIVRAPATTVVTLPIQPALAGKYFGGWWTAPIGVGTEFTAATTVTADMTVYAQWSDAPVHKVFFIANDGRAAGVMGSQSIPQHTGRTLDACVYIMGGFDFSGWATSADGAVVYADQAVFEMALEDVLLYARWQWKEYALRDIGPAGGLICHINPAADSEGWKYLEAAPSSVSLGWGKKPWGGWRSLIGISAQGLAIGKGIGNTAAIVASYGAAEPYENRADYAARLCDELVVEYGNLVYNDWFLPGRDELALLRSNLQQYGVGGFLREQYWSSSERNSDTAMSLHFRNGRWSSSRKYYQYLVHAVRAF
jgi:hypothetical protein